MTQIDEQATPQISQADENGIFDDTQALPPAKPSKNQDDKQIVRVSVSEAARLFGVNAQTIRRAIAAQELTYAVVAGHYKLNFESLVKWSQKHTTVRNRMNQRGIGQFVGKWKIKNPLFSPNPKTVPKEEAEKNQVV